MRMDPIVELSDMILLEAVLRLLYQDGHIGWLLFADEAGAGV